MSNSNPFSVQFTANQTSGRCSFRVIFTNQTSPLPSPSPSPSPLLEVSKPIHLKAAPSAPPAAVKGWFWDFGDGGKSTEMSPGHIYTRPGVFTVSLTLIDVNGNTFSCCKPNYITVIREKDDLGKTIILQTRAMITGKSATLDTVSMFNYGTERNSSLWSSAVDWSCIPFSGALGTCYTGVLVTSDILIQAEHAYVMGEIMFVNKEGGQEIANIIDWRRVGQTDIHVARLDRHVNCNPAQVFSSSSYSKLKSSYLSNRDIPVVYSNQFRQIHIGMLESVNVLNTVHRPTNDPNQFQFAPWYQSLYNGDSGAPLFMILDNKPILLGTWFLSDMNSYSLASSVGNQIPSINTLIADMGSTTRLEEAPLAGFV